MNATRYQRQTVLGEIGLEGQQNLAKARVLVVGAGGLGCPVLLYLAAAGVGQQSAGGYLGVIDDDTVDLSNLQRQVLFTENNVGQAKVLAAAQRLQAQNADIAIRPIQDRLNAANILSLLADYDMVVDGSDNFDTKYLINDAAVKLGKPVIYGSILGFEGQAAVFWADHGPCYRCLYPAPPKSYVPNCAEFGTLGGIAGLIGSVQAIEVCKLALGLKHSEDNGLEPLLGKLWCADARSMETRLLNVSKKSDCRICSQEKSAITLEETNPLICSSRPSSPSLTLADLQTRKTQGSPFLLLDVRQPAEWAHQHLPEAILIPLNKLMTDPAQLGKLKDAPEILVHCQHGIRSQTAVKFLRQQGINAIALNVDWSKVGV